MSWIRYITKFVGLSIISLILAVAMVVSLLFSIGILTAAGVILPDLNILNQMQKTYYFGGTRNIWQYQSNCVEAGGSLIYQPRKGECYFENLEFRTILTFDEAGRKNNFTFDPNLPKIAVLGDSHAMGWGVNDNNTFSAQLQRITERRVYNLGVSSYATERELDRLALMNDLNNIDTIIIQYCDNDLSENVQYPIDRNLALDRFTQAMKSYRESPYSTIFHNMDNALNSIVQKSIKLQIDESQHRHNIEEILINYSTLLKGKNVYVIFTSGHNKSDLPNNWVGSFTSHGLSVNFIDLNLQNHHFYRIDDHLNEHGHNHAATVLSQIIDKS